MSKKHATYKELNVFSYETHFQIIDGIEKWEKKQKQTEKQVGTEN